MARAESQTLQGDQTSRNLDLDMLQLSNARVGLSNGSSQMIDPVHSLDEDWARCLYDVRLLITGYKDANLGSEGQH